MGLLPVICIYIWIYNPYKWRKIDRIKLRLFHPCCSGVVTLAYWLNCWQRGPLCTSEIRKDTLNWTEVPIQTAANGRAHAGLQVSSLALSTTLQTCCGFPPRDAIVGVEPVVDVGWGRVGGLEGVWSLRQGTKYGEAGDSKSTFLSPAWRSPAELPSGCFFFKGQKLMDEFELSWLFWIHGFMKSFVCWKDFGVIENWTW